MTTIADIRKEIADVLRIPVNFLPCFTVIDHDGQAMIIVLHGGKHKGVYVESEDGTEFVKQKEK